MQQLNQAFHCLLWAGVISLVAGCGWQLRGLNNLEQAPSSLQLVAESPFSPMAQAMESVTHENNIKLDKHAQWILNLGQEALTKRTVAVTSFGSASQYELTLSVPFHYSQREGGPKGLPISMSTSRTFDYDPRNTTAKTQEEQSLLDEMRRELAFRILQQLTTAHGES